MKTNICHVEHSIDVKMPLDELFPIITNPENWPVFFPTARKVDIKSRQGNCVEFTIEEFVGKKKLFSHLFFKIDQENYTVAYEHDPVFLLKWMKIQWSFKDIGNGWTNFKIEREYDLIWPFLLNRLLGMTLVKRIINKHVKNYHNDLLEFVKIYNVLKFFEKNRGL